MKIGAKFFFRITMIVVFLLTVSIISPCQKKSIVGKWKTKAGYCLEFTKEGRWSVAEASEAKPFDFGNYTLDGKQLTLHTDEKAGTCAGKTGKYEVNITVDGKIKYTLIEDECSDRSGDLADGPYESCAP
jgi:hypothetical protein